jgi:hypothetical protein
MTNRRVNRRRSSFLLWSGMMQIIRVYYDSQSLLFSVNLFSFCDAEEWRSRSGRSGRRKIAIDHPSIANDGTAFLDAANTDRAVSSGKSSPVHGAQLGVFKWGLLLPVCRNENGSTHGMGPRHNEHAVGARRMRNYLIQPYPDSQGATR